MYLLTDVTDKNQRALKVERAWGIISCMQLMPSSQRGAPPCYFANAIRVDPMAPQESKGTGCVFRYSHLGAHEPEPTTTTDSCPAMRSSYETDTESFVGGEEFGDVKAPTNNFDDFLATHLLDLTTILRVDSVGAKKILLSPERQHQGFNSVSKCECQLCDRLSKEVLFGEELEGVLNDGFGGRVSVRLEMGERENGAPEPRCVDVTSPDGDATRALAHRLLRTMYMLLSDEEWLEFWAQGVVKHEALRLQGLRRAGFLPIMPGSMVFDQISLLCVDGTELPCMADQSVLTYKVRGVNLVYNPVLSRRFAAAKDFMAHKLGSYEDGVLQQRLLFHGTSAESAFRICHGDAGIDPRLSASHGRLGAAAYFATVPIVAQALYGSSMESWRDGGRIIISDVLCGRCKEVGTNMAPFPPKKSDSHFRYDSVFANCISADDAPRQGAGVNGLPYESGLVGVYESFQSCPRVVVDFAMIKRRGPYTHGRESPSSSSSTCGFFLPKLSAVPRFPLPSQARRLPRRPTGPVPLPPPPPLPLPLPQNRNSERSQRENGIQLNTFHKVVGRTPFAPP